MKGQIITSETSKIEESSAAVRERRERECELEALRFVE
jgi:hypothetical protein